MRLATELDSDSLVDSDSVESSPDSDLDESSPDSDLDDLSDESDSDSRDEELDTSPATSERVSPLQWWVRKDGVEIRVGA